MEEVLEKLETTTVVGEDSEERSNFQDLYKNWGRLGNQEERRKELLEIQKHDRNNKLDKLRGILEIVQKNEEKDILFRSNLRAQYNPNVHVAGFHRKSTYYDMLMLSEWLIEKPQDFFENWYTVPCPKGKRVLVVASYGTTKLFSKNGKLLAELRTGLPGGNPSCKRASSSVIDCIYDEKLQTLHVLDLLAWNNQPMTDCDTEFRQFWLRGKFSEISQLNVLNKLNSVIFNLLPMVQCTPESFNSLMMTYPAFNDNIPELDGLLFYHKKAHYVSGETPLVGWLFPYMVPEVFGSDVTVHPKYMELKPEDYVNQPDYIQKFEQKYAKRRNRRSKMSTSDSSVTTNSDKTVAEDGDAMEAEEVKVQTEAVVSELAALNTDDQNAANKIESTKETDDSNNTMEAEEAPK